MPKMDWDEFAGGAAQGLFKGVGLGLTARGQDMDYAQRERQLDQAGLRQAFEMGGTLGDKFDMPTRPVGLSMGAMQMAQVDDPALMAMGYGGEAANQPGQIGGVPGTTPTTGPWATPETPRSAIRDKLAMSEGWSKFFSGLRQGEQEALLSNAQQRMEARQQEGSLETLKDFNDAISNATQLRRSLEAADALMAPLMQQLKMIDGKINEVNANAGRFGFSQQQVQALDALQAAKEEIGEKIKEVSKARTMTAQGGLAAEKEIQRWERIMEQSRVPGELIDAYMDAAVAGGDTTGMARLIMQYMMGRSPNFKSPGFKGGATKTPGRVPYRGK